jgi:transcriptional regulator with XRE-family HTH domain
MTPEPVSPTLYTLRLHAGYRSQAALAAKLGLSVGSYARIETGRVGTTPQIAARLARALGVTPGVVWAILWGEENASVEM